MSFAQAFPRNEQTSAKEWPRSGLLVGFILGYSLASLHLVEVLYEASVRFQPLGSGMAAWYLLKGIIFLLWPISLALGIFGGRFGWPGTAVTIAGAVLQLTLIREFRGVHIWDGTFDLYSQDGSEWFKPVLYGNLLGVAIGWASSLKRPPDHKKLLSVSKISVLILAATVLITIFATVYWPADSVFAPSRPYVLAGAATVLICIWISALWSYHNASN
ncbi:MAG TPA: hypothetical protein VJ835_08440 [Fimbriimonadaceae bacterium]|nr:hypothetical protein [Fimbriimonadaceae bacterium]